MKKPKVAYFPIDGTGVLHLDFQPGPFGDATEAKRGDGVGFFTANGELMGVTFDDVTEEQDHQVLEFDRYRIEVTTKRGEISYAVAPIKPQRARSRPKAGQGKDVA